MKTITTIASKYFNIIFIILLIFCYPQVIRAEEQATENIYFQGVHLLEVEKNYKIGRAHV